MSSGQWNTWQSLLAVVGFMAVFGLFAWLSARHVDRQIREQEDQLRPRTGAGDTPPPNPRTGPATNSPAADNPITDELDSLWEWLGAAGYVLHSFQLGDHGPEVFAGVRALGDMSDVFIMWSADNACAYRCPTGRALDVFEPQYVYWSYASNAVWTVRALIALAPPDHPDAPTTLMPAQQGVGIPAALRTHDTIHKPEW